MLTRPLDTWVLIVLCIKSRNASCEQKAYHRCSTTASQFQLFGPLSPIATDGSKFILTISDYFSKYFEAVPTPDKYSSHIASLLYKGRYYYIETHQLLILDYLMSLFLIVVVNSTTLLIMIWQNNLVLSSSLLLHITCRYSKIPSLTCTLRIVFGIPHNEYVKVVWVCCVTYKYMYIILCFVTEMHLILV